MSTRMSPFTMVVIMLACVPAYGEANRESDLYEKLMEVSGINSQTGEVGERMAPGMVEIFSTGKLSTKRAAKLVGAFKQSLGKELILGDIKARLESTLPAEDAREVLDWLESPLGRHFTEVEIESDLPENQAARSAFSGEVSKQSEARKSLVSELIEAMGSVELEMKCYGRFAETMELYMALDRGKKPPSVEERRVPVEAYLREKAGDFKESRLSGSLYCYRDIPDDDVQQYLNFIQSDVGKKYHDAVNAALYSALSDAYKRFDSEMLAIYGKSAE